MKHIAGIIVLMGILLWVPPLHADVYSWTDENGVKYFGNQPPDNAANVRVVFKEEPYNAAADNQSKAAQSQDITELIRDLEQEEARQAAEARRKAEAAAKNRQPTQQERIAAEKQRLQEKITELEEKLSWHRNENIELLAQEKGLYNEEGIELEARKQFNMTYGDETNISVVLDNETDDLMAENNNSEETYLNNDLWGNIKIFYNSEIKN